MSDDEKVWLENKPMGQRLCLTTLPGETGGEYFVTEYINEPWKGRHGVPAHFHPTWTETFEVLSGRARCLLGGEEHDIETGGSIVLPPWVPHINPWSNSDEPLHVRQTAVSDPPDEAALTANLQAAVTIFGLAGVGKVNQNGTPHFLQLAVLLNSARPATYPAGAPKWLLDLVIPVLSGVGRMFGKKVIYPEFALVQPDRVKPPG